MTHEQIEKAAGEISYHPFIEIERQGFIRGANWRIKSVWHGPEEEPKHKELCLIELKSKISLLAYSIHFKGEQPYFEACFIKYGSRKPRNLQFRGGIEPSPFVGLNDIHSNI